MLMGTGDDGPHFRSTTWDYVAAAGPSLSIRFRPWSTS